MLVEAPRQTPQRVDAADPIVEGRDVLLGHGDQYLLSPSRISTLDAPVMRSTRRSDLQRATESPGGIVGLYAVVIGEDGVVAPVTEEGTAELSDAGRRPHPA